MKKFEQITKKEFINLNWNEVYSYLLSKAEYLNTLDDWNGEKIEDEIRTLARIWNNEQTCLSLLSKGEKGGSKIDVYRLWETDFIGGKTYGLGVEDDYIIFKEYREEYEAYREKQLQDFIAKQKNERH